MAHDPYKYMGKFLKALGGKWNKPEALSSYHRSKYMHRAKVLRRRANFIILHLPEYEKGGYKVLDISCGSGAFLETMRYFGNEVYGTDVGYFPFLESQNIPYCFMDCTVFPYPFDSNSFDLVSCIGSMTFYRPFDKVWPRALSEFARIAKKTIFVTINVGSNCDEYSYLIDEWKDKEWELMEKDGSFYKWERI